MRTNDLLVRPGKRFRLADRDPASTADVRDEAQAARLLAASLEQLYTLQEKLYAQDTWALLLVFQGMDASGKDSAIKHVMRGVNPQGCQVFSFKAPSAEELDHDYLWRTTRRLPERGRIGVFNRSYYEEVLVVRVHPELLAAQRLPRAVSDRIWEERFADMVAHERHLTRNGTVIRKFFLHVSREEQRRRFLARLDDPRRHWKFALRDVREREHWDDYMHAYEDMLGHTSTRDAPWYVIPADHKWFARAAVAQIVVETLADLGVDYPRLDRTRREEVRAARALLAPRGRR
jgi:PPK2 family polyphosphate:nucleotide phosphotransferase